MGRIVFFCIPAYGHTNPTLGVVRELTRRGHQVIYYSFEQHRAAIEAAGAKFMGCDRFDLGLETDENSGTRVAKDLLFATELIVRSTLAMEETVLNELKALRPDVIVADSVATWGKLFAEKLGVPYIISTTTFAFNKHSSQGMSRGTLRELFAFLGDLRKTGKLLKPLRDRGYPAKNIISLIQSDESTDAVVFTSKLFQPASETFSDRYAFVGPVIRPVEVPFEKGEKPLLYISMGTINNRFNSFYRDCIEAFSDGKIDVLMSVGEGVDIASLGALPKNIRVRAKVDQIAVLKEADAFITHCGMNSASEGLYFDVPLVLFPQTNEQTAVANRAKELGAGVTLDDTSANGIRQAVEKVLNDAEIKKNAARIGQSLREAGGAEAAAEKIERKIRN